MKGGKRLLRVAWLVLCLPLPGILWGQDIAASSPSSGTTEAQPANPANSSASAPQAGGEAAPAGWGGFQNHGSVDMGYRFTDVKGAQQGFLQFFNLKKGPRLMNFDLFGESVPGANPFADTFSLHMSGLGGDPFPSAQLAISKTHLYDLRVDWRQSYFYDAFPLAPASLGGFSTQSLTDNHSWATVRKFGSVNLNLHATSNLHFLFNYHRASDTGELFTTRPLIFLDSPSPWNAFARANPFFLGAPTNNTANRFTGGLNYTRGSWSFHYAGGYQTYDESLTLTNLTSPQQSINGDPVTANETLDNLSWSQYRRLTTPSSEFSYTGKPAGRLRMYGGYIYYRYQGPVSLDASASGTARTTSNGSTDSPYALSLATRGRVIEPDHILNQGFTYSLTNWWEWNVDYRYSRFTTDVVANQSSLITLYPFPDGTTTNAASETASMAWKDGISTLDVNMLFTPSRSLVIRPGLKLVKADIEGLEDGEADDAHTRRINTAWPELSVYYQPSKIFSVRARLSAMYNNAAYTLMSPMQDVGTHEVIRFQPLPKLAIEEALDISTAKLISAGFVSKTRSTGTMITYTLNENVSVFAGLDYLSLLGTGKVTFERGTPPLDNVGMRDQQIDRIWQAGFALKPHRNFGLQFSGNFDRATGRGEIAGEPPLYGPVTFPYATGTVYYEFPKAGRLSIDLQRSYYLEQILGVNNFSANMLTIRWTKQF